MARLLAQTLTLARPAPTFSLRGLVTKAEVIEIDLSEEDAAAPPSSHASSNEAATIRRLDEAIQSVVVRRLTPEWLPFVPGGSFWVPQVRRPPGVAELMARIAAAERGVGGGAVDVVELDAPMTEEEARSLCTARGWPSASYFVEECRLSSRIELDQKQKQRQDLSSRILPPSKDTYTASCINLFVV